MTSIIKCKGWVAPKEVSKWSPDAITLNNDIIVYAPAVNQVRVKIYAAGLNPVDYKRVSFPKRKPKKGAEGLPGEPIPKLYHEPTAFPFPYVLGCDGAGVVESVGQQVTDFKEGDFVVFHSDIAKSYGGSFCEYAIVDADVLVSIPQKDGKPVITLEEAASLPCTAWTAYVALFDKLRIERGRSIFINGAAGGLGSFAVQLARHFGLIVFASSSAKNMDYVRSLGAEEVYDYHTGGAMIDDILKQTDGYGVDYYLEVSDAASAEDYSDVLRFGGSMCLISGLLIPKTELVFTRQLSVHYVFFGALHGHPTTRPQIKFVGEQVLKLYLQKAFSVDVECIPFDKIAEGLDRFANGENRKGRVVAVLESL